MQRSEFNCFDLDSTEFVVVNQESSLPLTDLVFSVDASTAPDTMLFEDSRLLEEPSAEYVDQCQVGECILFERNKEAFKSPPEFMLGSYQNYC